MMMTEISYGLEIRANGDSIEITGNDQFDNEFVSQAEFLYSVEENACNNMYLNAVCDDLDEDEDENEYSESDYTVQVEVRYFTNSMTTTINVDAYSKKEAEQQAESLIRDSLFFYAYER